MEGYPEPNTDIFVRTLPNGPHQIVGAGRYCCVDAADAELAVLQQGYHEPLRREGVTHAVFLQSRETGQRVVLQALTDANDVDLYLGECDRKYGKYGDVYCVQVTRTGRTPLPRRWLPSTKARQ